MAVKITSAIKHALDKMNKASQDFGGFGAFFLGGSGVPASGSISALAAVRYSSHPALGTNTAITAAIGLTASAQTGLTANIAHQPDYPRVLLAKGVGANLAGNVVIHGLDFSGAVVSDTIALNGAAAVNGVVAFKSVTSIDLPARTNGSGDTVSIGTANIIGFPVALANASDVIAHWFNGATDAGSVTAAATISGTLYTPSGTLDGTKILLLDYLA